MRKLDEAKYDLLERRKNLIDTVRVFSYFVKDKSFFFELIDELKEKTCTHCGTNTGEEILIHIMKMFGGLTVKIPSYEELKLYKFLLDHDEIIVEYFQNKKETVRNLHRRLERDHKFKLLGEVDVEQVLENLGKEIQTCRILMKSKSWKPVDYDQARRIKLQLETGIQPKKRGRPRKYPLKN